MWRAEPAYSRVDIIAKGNKITYKARSRRTRSLTSFFPHFQNSISQVLFYSFFLPHSFHKGSFVLQSPVDMKFVTALISLSTAATLITVAACPGSAGAGAAYCELWRHKSLLMLADHNFIVITNE